MPVIARFYGIMGNVTGANLPQKTPCLVRDWAQQYKDELEHMRKTTRLRREGGPRG